MSYLLTRKESEQLTQALKNAGMESQADWKPSKGRNPFATCVDRRTFLRGGAALVGGVALRTRLFSLLARSASAASIQIQSPYGIPPPTPDESTGLSLLKLPPGFRYQSFGWTGDPMDNGNRTPNLHDGMAVVREMGRWLLLVRNHETATGTPFTKDPYSPEGGGGTTNLIWDQKSEKFVSNYPSLSGTIRKLRQRTDSLGNLADV